MAVVLRHRIGAATRRRSTAPCRSRTDTARTSEEFPRDSSWPEPQQHLPRSSRRRGSTSARTRAMPGWIAGPSRLISTCASDGAQRVDERLRDLRARQVDAIELLAPLARRPYRAQRSTTRCRHRRIAVGVCSGRSSDDRRLLATRRQHRHRTATRRTRSRCRRASRRLPASCRRQGQSHGHAAVEGAREERICGWCAEQTRLAIDSSTTIPVRTQ